MLEFVVWVFWCNNVQANNSVIKYGKYSIRFFSTFLYLLIDNIFFPFFYAFWSDALLTFRIWIIGNHAEENELNTLSTVWSKWRNWKWKNTIELDENRKHFQKCWRRGEDYTFFCFVVHNYFNIVDWWIDKHHRIAMSMAEMNKNRL